MRVLEAVDLGAIATYPRMGHDFPRRNVPITPSENLYDARRVFLPMGRIRMIPTGQTVLWQPRVESTLYLMETT